MPPTAEHEALHRVFHRDEALFARAVARVFGVQVPAPEPGRVTVLSTDLTETAPLERHADSVLQAEFLIEDLTGKYILVIESQTDEHKDRRGDMEGHDGDQDLPLRLADAPARPGGRPG